MLNEGPIISAERLGQLLHRGEDLLFLDVRKDRAAYDAGHLRGALYADSNLDLSSPGDPARGGRHPLPAIAEWCRTLGTWGVTPGTRIVVYDDQSCANAAARAWWMLRAVGHARVSALDGGFEAALAADLGATTEVPMRPSAPPYPARAWDRSMVDISTVDRLREDPEWVVIDVRAAPRFAALEERLDPVAGHIPGAINVPFMLNLDGGRYKSASELRSLYAERIGAVRPDQVVVHCGSGVTGCHTLLALELAGLTGAALYVGGWSEWCRSTYPKWGLTPASDAPSGSDPLRRAPCLPAGGRATVG